MSNTQYRIYEKIFDSRCYVASAWVDSLGVASYSWCSGTKNARLFDSAAIAESMAKAMEKTIADKFGKKIKLVIVPASGGHSKLRR